MPAYPQLPFDLRSIDRHTLFYNSDMVDENRASGQTTPRKAQHLCVVVHGLWGNPTHLNYVTNTLRERHGEDQLIVLACKRNAGSFTYDGIEVGAERVAKETEEYLNELAREGYKIRKISFVGYSLGGLVARYAVGLLYHKGHFEKITPVNFTTFATPHLGVRTPLTGFPNHLWNILGARTLSTSGRQLFTIDNFRDTGRSILSILADPDSIFIHALAQFQNRSLYANVTNDRSAVYYTTGISRNDPYIRMDKLDFHYAKGYEPVILDPDHPYDVIQEKQLPSVYQRFATGSSTFITRAPLILALAVIIPIASIAFLINSSIQTFRSRRRILLHETDREARGFGGYRIPYLMQDMRAGLEDAFENVNSAQGQDYLPDGSEEIADRNLPRSSVSAESVLSEKSEADSLYKGERSPEFPTLALTTAQFAMIKALDDVGFRKYPVYIHKSSHSHAAIIVRNISRKSMEEGKVVVKHWLDNEFKI